jgi:hypothetical protein
MGRAVRLALLAIVTGTLLAAAPAQAAPAVGIQTLRIFNNGDRAEYARELDLVRSVGARFVRVELSWAELEPADDQLDQGVLAVGDALMADARRRGLKVLLVLQRTPCWVSTKPERSCETPEGRDAAAEWPPSDDGQYAQIAALVARRWAADLQGLEVWNEPDQANELYWAGPDKAVGYARLLKAAYPAIKAAAPQVPVLGAAIVGFNGRFLEALYREGIKGSYDVLSVHFYDLVLTSLRTIREVQERNGDRAPVFLAETGFSSCAPQELQSGQRCYTRRGQAQLTTDVLRATRRTSWLVGVSIFGLRDSEQYDMGIFDARGRGKPVAAALRSWLRRPTSKPRQPVLRLQRRAAGIRITFSGPGADAYVVDVRQRGARRYLATVRLDADNRLALTLPRQIRGRGISVRLTHLWTGATVRRTI